MTMAEPEKRRAVEWQGSYQGMSIYTDETIPHDVIEFRDESGTVLGRIYQAKRVYIGAGSFPNKDGRA